ncbi:WYL domain-containing protein [Leucobacter zeae]|nr:WYL domain-containing protein [Leucobacter zeae]
MDKALLAPDRVLLLLSLVPYLREHGPTTIDELAEAFSVRPALLRALVRFLGTAGVPGETLSYQHEDLFDIDWDALEQHDVVSLTRTVAVDDAPRFAPTETAALIAGLQALTGVLGEADAALARATAEKLGAALGSAGRAGITVTADREDPRVAEILAAIDSGGRLEFAYRDASGSQTSRTVAPYALTQGGGTWYLRGFCFEREADRTFRVDQIASLRRAEGPDPEDDARSRGASDRAAEGPDPAAAARSGRERAAADSDRGIEIVARVRERALPRLQGFRPEPIGQPEEGWVAVRIAAWYPEAAIRAVLVAPGDVVVVSPETAVELVRDWAARSLAAYGG